MLSTKAIEELTKTPNDIAVVHTRSRRMTETLMAQKVRSRRRVQGLTVSNTKR